MIRDISVVASLKWKIFNLILKREVAMLTEQ